MLKLIGICLSFLSLKSYALIGGVEVSESDPLSKSVVALQMVEKQTDGKINFYKGSGVLVQQNVVLTASHNLFYLNDVTMSEVIFSTKPDWGTDPLGQKRIPIERVLFYPGFSQGPLGTQNDMALVFLRESAPFEYKPLPIQLDNIKSPEVGEVGILRGYGRNSQETSPPISNYRLRSLALKFARWDNSSAEDSQKIWFSNQGGSIAGGDSGGPVLLKRNNSYVIYGIGIHARYDSCVKQNTCEAQSAYSNTSYFADWIEKSLQ